MTEKQEAAIERLKQMDCLFVKPEDVKDVLECTAQAIRDTALTNVNRFGFKVCRIGKQTKIHRQSFIRWVEDER